MEKIILCRIFYHFHNMISSFKYSKLQKVEKSNKSKFITNNTKIMLG